VRVRRLGMALLRVCPPASLCFLAVVDPSVLYAEEAAPRQIAAVTVAAKDEDVEAFVNALREPLEALGLTVHASGAGSDARPPPEDISEARVRVVVDARPSDHVDILVWVMPQDRTGPVQRRVPRGPSTPVLIEDVAYAVRATVASLLAEHPPVRAAPTPTPAPAKAPPPPPEHRRPGRFGLDVAGFAGVRGIAASAPPAFGGGAALDFAFWGRQPGRPSLYLGAYFYAPIESSTSEVTLEATVISLRAIPSVELARVGPLRFAAGAGGGVDVFHAEPQPTETAAATLGPETTLVDPVLEAQMLVRIIVGGASLFFGFDLDYDLNPDRYYQSDRSGTSSSVSVLTEWSVRPAGMLGVCLPVAGVSACKDAE
jgi:hypothetical protein